MLPYVPSGDGRGDADLDRRRRGRRRRNAQVCRHRRDLRLGRRPPAQPAVVGDGHLRDARQGLHQARRACARRPARDLCGPGVGRGDRVPPRPRRHRGRAAAGAPHRRRAVPRREGPDELLGLQLDRLLRPALAVLGHRRPGRATARVQGHGQGAPPRRHGSDPRRRLQPHRGRQPPRSDARVPRHRQPVVLPALAGGSALLRRLHRHRQQPQPGAPERAAAHHGLAALLRDRVPRRRVPLRPRGRARPRVPRGRPAVGVLRHHLPGPDPVAGEADRRAVGHRRGRLPGRQLSRALDRVERPVPRRRARLLARSGPHRRLHRSLRGFGRPLPARRPPAVRVDQLRHRARRLHARGSRRRTTRSTTRRTSRTTATAPTTTGVGTAAPRARPTIRRSTVCAPASSATSSRR